MPSIKDEIRAGIAEWPSFKQFMLLLVIACVIGIGGPLTWDMLQDAWQSNNPWIYILAGAGIAIGSVIFFFFAVPGDAGAGDAPPPAADDRNDKTPLA